MALIYFYIQWLEPIKSGDVPFFFIPKSPSGALSFVSLIEIEENRELEKENGSFYFSIT